MANWQNIAQAMVDKACNADGDSWFRREMTVEEAIAYSEVAEQL